MKVAVIASPKDGGHLIKILETLAAAEVSAYGLKIGEGWSELRRDRLSAHLGKVSHYLIVSTPTSVATTWFAYAAGYANGRMNGIAFFRLDPGFSPPPYLANLPIIDTLDELAAYYQSEQAEWVVRQERQSTRAALLTRGISYHAESLAHCVKEGDLEAVELFLRSGFHPDSRDRHGVTLLCLATRNRRKAVAEILLNRGAALDLRSDDRGYSPLMDAALVGSVELMELFLSRGAHPDISSKDGQTALIVCVGRNDPQMVALLLNHGADPDLGDKLGLSARKYASLFKNAEILSLLSAVSA